VLLDGEMNAHVSDFGVARYKSADATMTQGVGTGRWLAPEVISGASDYDQSCDIFSFGVVLAEMDTHALPYDDVRGPGGHKIADVAVLQLVAAGRLLPSFSRECPPRVRELALRCMAYNRSERPSAVEIAYALRSLQKSVELSSGSYVV
jgi:serine/threonine protein kinase